MIKTFLYFLLFLFPHLSAKEIDFPDKIRGSIGVGFLEPPPPAALPKDPASYNPQIPKVNVITGAYCEQSVDLIVAGSQPLSLRRFYTHFGPQNQAFGHWMINPESFFLYNFELSINKNECFASVGERSGSVFLYGIRNGNTYSLDTVKLKGYTNSANPYSTGQEHPLNKKVIFSRTAQDSQFSSFAYSGTITDGGGRVRCFETKTRKWPTDQYYEDTTNESRMGGGPCIPLLPFPPYLAPLTEERLPNGNVLKYTYVDYNDFHLYHKWYANLPEFYILESIKAYSSQGTFLGSLRFEYSRANHNVQIIGSDERRATYIMEERSIKSYPDILLSSIETPNHPKQKFHYPWTKHNYWNNNHIAIASGEGTSFLRTAYHDLTKKVLFQFAPVGENGKEEPIASYDYQDHYTLVYDGEKNLTKYTYNDDERIETIIKFQDRTPYRIEKNQWNSKTGTLKSKKFEDRSKKIFLALDYEYDENNNLISEKTGDGKESYTVTRTYSKDGFNLKTSEDDGSGKKTVYAYIPGTNLLSSELIYVNGKIRKRAFHIYGDGAIRIKAIIDDGSSLDPNDLMAVTYRKITLIHPRMSSPCIGLPETVEEKTIDKKGHEILLKKVRYAYHPSGKITKEEHFDSNNVLQYTLVNEYNNKELLIAKIDPMGNRTVFSYDNNHNLITIAGPRSDQLCKFHYDAAERIVKVEERQSDHSFLAVKKEYDKAGRVIAEIDECDFKTTFHYDNLGRLIKTVHPDGCIEKKDYDILNNVILEADCNGYETRKEYNYRNQPVAIHYPDGSNEYFAYNANGTLKEHIDKNEAKALYTYDAFYNPIETRIYAASGKLLKTSSASYSSFQKLSETDGEGITTIYSYDFAGRKIAEERAGKKIYYSYDTLSRLYKTQDDDAVFIIEYDHLNRPIEKRTEDLSGNIIEQEKYAYDPAGNQSQIIRSQGTFFTEYNTKGQPLVKRDPLGFETRCSYSYQNGFVKTITNPKGIQTIQIHDCRGRETEVLKKNTLGDTIYHEEKNYDGNGNVLQATHHLFQSTTPLKSITHTYKFLPGNLLAELLEADEKKTQYIYDTSGRIQTKIKPDKTLLNYEYDGLGRLSRFYATDFDYRYIYDRCDRLLSVFDAIAKKETHRTYNAFGSILEEKLANGLALTNKYDSQGKREKLTLPDKTTIQYSYLSGYLYQVSRKGYTHTYTQRDLDGNLSHAELPDKLGSIQIERDPFFRWARFFSPFYSSTFNGGYDPVGNLCHYSYTDSLGTVEACYDYDDLNQLISENEHTYLWDSLSNRLKKDDQEHRINDLCQITHDGQTSYKYDINGNLLSDGKRSYIYDTQDRLIQIKEGNRSILLTYDPFHRRLSKSIRSGNFETERFNYLWDGENEIGVYDDFNSATELRVLGEGFGAEIGAAVLFELSGTTYVPIHDHRGCLVSLIDLKKRKPAESYRYTAYGEELTKSTLSPWRFSSKRIDPETGFLYFGRRYYSPPLGRWITPDPQGFQDGPNLYAYLHNSPLLYFDLYGLRCTSFSDTRNVFDFFDWLAYDAACLVESIGQHLIPVPGVRDLVECTGRWLHGGNFWQKCDYWNAHHEVFMIGDGNMSETTELPFSANGVCNSREEAAKKAAYQKEKYGTDLCMVVYFASKGFSTDLLTATIAKLGIISPGEKYAASEIAQVLRDHPGLMLYGEAHSRGGTNMLNISKVLGEDYSKRIHLATYGSATLIQKGIFADIENNVSNLDFVSFSNPINYLIARLGFSDHVNFLPASSHNPFKEHFILGDTYSRAIEDRGQDFIMSHK